MPASVSFHRSPVAQTGRNACRQASPSTLSASTPPPHGSVSSVQENMDEVKGKCEFDEREFLSAPSEGRRSSCCLPGAADGSPPPPSLDGRPAGGFGRRTGSRAPAPAPDPFPPSGCLTRSPREFLSLRFIIPPVSLQQLILPDGSWCWNSSSQPFFFFGYYYIFVRIVRIPLFSKQEKTFFLFTFPDGKIAHANKMMWPELFRHSGKPFSPRAKGAKEEVKQRRTGNKKKKRERFSFKDFLRQKTEPSENQREHWQNFKRGLIIYLLL